MTFAAREVVTTPEGQHFLVRAVPKGGRKAVTPSDGPVTWLSAVPGGLGLLGLFLNKVVYRGRWLVLICPIVHGQPTTATRSMEAKNMNAANQLAGEAIERLRQGLPLTT